MALTMTRFVSLLIVTVLFSSAAEARCEVDITDYVGWQIIYSGTVTGYLDENGQEEDSFEGCEYGRVLIVDYSKSVTPVFPPPIQPFSITAILVITNSLARWYAAESPCPPPPTITAW